MATIESVDAIVVSLPERRKHLMAQINSKQGEYVIVKIRADGVVGLGEATVLRQWGGDYGRYYGEIPELTVRLIKDYLGPGLVGEDPSRFGYLAAKMNSIVKGYPYAKAGVDIALYDLVGRLEGVPVYKLLGGRLRKAVPVAHSLGIMDTAPLLAEVTAAIAEGVKTIKLKVGLDPDRDISVVHEVREHVGPDIAITVDANQGWSDPKSAIRVIRAMEGCGVRFVEQPVEGLDAMREVTSAVGVPIMADESAWNEHDALEIARSRAADMLSIYTTKPGGLYGAQKVAAVATAAGFPCNVNGSAETGVGNAANLHLAAAMPCVSEACVLPVSAPAEDQPTQTAGRFYLDDIITEAFQYRDGSLIVPDKPGLGVELDEDKIAKYLVES